MCVNMCLSASVRVRESLKKGENDRVGRCKQRKRTHLCNDKNVESGMNEV